MGGAYNSEDPEKVGIEGGRIVRGSQLLAALGFPQSCTGGLGRVQLAQVCGKVKEQNIQGRRPSGAKKKKKKKRYTGKEHYYY